MYRAKNLTRWPQKFFSGMDFVHDCSVCTSLLYYNVGVKLFYWIDLHFIELIFREMEFQKWLQLTTHSWTSVNRTLGTSIRYKFHLHFYIQIFCTNVISAAFSSYILALVKNSYKKFVHLTFMKLTAGINFTQCYTRLFHQYFCAKKLQRQNVTREKLFKALSCKKHPR